MYSDSDTVGNIAAGDWMLTVELGQNLSDIWYTAPNGTTRAANFSALPLAFMTDSMGSIMPLFFWLYLADFGQTTQTSSFNNESLTTYNIFVNETLYEDMASWIVSLVHGYDDPFPAFDETNGLPMEPAQTFLVASYSCTQRQLKSPVSLIITVIAADYALIVGGYSFVKWIAMFLETRRRNGECMPSK
jgi:hypothetical protein